MFFAKLHDNEAVRIAVLWSHLSGYMNACLRELEHIDNVEIFVGHYTPSVDSPFEREQFSWIANRYEYEACADKSVLLSRLIEFSPDVFLVTSWHIPEYRFILKKFSGKAVKVLAMDNPWRGTLKQWLGIVSSRWYLQPLYDAVFLPGERQAQFAKKLGFTEKQILRGLYCCDQEKYAVSYQEREQSRKEMPTAFIYVGRLSLEKGIETLKKGYQYYRDLSKRPWPLICCGTGPLEHLLQDVDGMVLKGFIQPEDLPNEMKKAGCLLIPSLFEPWGVVVHEATSAGLPVICTSSCGASVHLVQDGYNGYVVEPGKADNLGEAMLRYTQLSYERKTEMSANSYNLSLQFTPKRWATCFYERVKELMQEQPD